MSLADFGWYLFYVDLILIPFAWWVNHNSIKREIARDNVYLEKLAREHPDQWRKNAH